MARAELRSPPPACASVWERVTDVILLHEEGSPGPQRSSGEPKIPESGGQPALVQSQAGASSLWVRWCAHGLDLQLEPLSTDSIARGPDPSLDTDLGQTQKGATSEAFPLCVVAPGRWVTPLPAVSKA